MELHSRTLHGSLQAMSIRPFTWKDAKLSLSNSSERGPHISHSLIFHFSRADTATQSCVLSKTRTQKNNDEKIMCLWLPGMERLLYFMCLIFQLFIKL